MTAVSCLVGFLAFLVFLYRMVIVWKDASDAVPGRLDVAESHKQQRLFAALGLLSVAAVKWVTKTFILAMSALAATGLGFVCESWSPEAIGKLWEKIVEGIQKLKQSFSQSTRLP